MAGTPFQFVVKMEQSEEEKEEEEVEVVDGG